jgi:hypothetical protein
MTAKATPFGSPGAGFEAWADNESGRNPDPSAHRRTL